MKRLKIATWLSVTGMLLGVGCTLVESDGKSGTKNNPVLFQTDFSEANDLARAWRWEGQGRVALENGKLALQEDNGDGVVLWLRQNSPSDMQLQFDLSFNNKLGIGVFFIAAKGTGGEDILTDQPERDGKYNLYTHGKINCYGFSLHRFFPDGRNNPGSNIRKNSGFHLVNHAETDPVPEANQPYRVKIEKAGGRLRLWVDGSLVHDWKDDEALGEVLTDGKIGFRIRGHQSCIMYLDNVLVTAL